MLCFLIRCLTRKTIVKKHVSIVFLKLLDVLFQFTIIDVEQSLWMKVFRMEGDIFQVSWVKLSFLFIRDDSILCSDNLFHLLKEIVTSLRLSLGLRFLMLTGKDLSEDVFLMPINVFSIPRSQKHLTWNSLSHIVSKINVSLLIFPLPLNLYK